MSVSTLCRKAKESVYAADMLLKSAEIALEEAKVAKDLSSSVFKSLANNSEFISEVTAAKEAFEASEMGLKSSEIAHQAASVAKIKAERLYGRLQLIFDSRRDQPMIGCSNCKSNPCISGNILNEGNVLIGMRVREWGHQDGQMATVARVFSVKCKGSKRRVRVRWDSNKMSADFRFITKSKNPRFLIACQTDQKIEPPKSSYGIKSPRSSPIMIPSSVSSSKASSYKRTYDSDDSDEESESETRFFAENDSDQETIPSPDLAASSSRPPNVSSTKTQMELRVKGEYFEQDDVAVKTEIKSEDSRSGSYKRSCVENLRTQRSLYKDLLD